MATDYKLRWKPPELTNPTTITVTNANRSLKLDDAKDYTLVMPTGITAKGGLSISGGRNVVLIGGQIHTPSIVDGPADNDRRALYLKNQTGTVHIEGLTLSGPALTDAIDLDQRLGAIVQLQNIRVTEIYGTQATNHADIIQSWGGPKTLRIDGLLGITTYQGLFLTPHQFDSSLALVDWDFRNIGILGDNGAGYLLWKSTAEWPITCRNVLVQRIDGSTTKNFWPDAAAWPGVAVGSYVTSDMIRGNPGVGYVSPGYVTNETPIPDPDPEPDPDPNPDPTPEPQPEPTPIPSAPATLRQQLIEWTEATSYERPVVRYKSDADDVIASMDVVWPDGSSGLFTTTAWSTVNRAHLVTGFTITHDESGYYVLQEPKTLRADGTLAYKPPLVIARSGRYATLREWLTGHATLGGPFADHDTLGAAFGAENNGA